MVHLEVCRGKAASSRAHSVACLTKHVTAGEVVSFWQITLLCPRVWRLCSSSSESDTSSLMLPLDTEQMLYSKHTPFLRERSRPFGRLLVSVVQFMPFRITQVNFGTQTVARTS